VSVVQLSFTTKSYSLELINIVGSMSAE